LRETEQAEQRRDPECGEYRHATANGSTNRSIGIAAVANCDLQLNTSSRINVRTRTRQRGNQLFIIIYFIYLLYIVVFIVIIDEIEI